MECQIPEYIERYRNLLAGRNLYYLNLLLSTIRAMTKFLKRCEVDKRGDSKSGEIFRTNDFLFSAGCDNINLLKLKRYISSSTLARKVGGFLDNKHAVIPGESSSTSTTSTLGSMSFAIRAFQSLLGCLASSDADGRIHLLVTESMGLCLKYVALNPSVYFSKIALKAKSGMYTYVEVFSRIISCYSI
jgi:chromosome transmission fidelity protein 1